MHGGSKKEITRTKYLLPVTSKGIQYLYFRHKKLGKPIALPLDQSSAEFKRCYDNCIKALGAAAKAPAEIQARQKHIPFVGGTFGKAVEVYKRSPEWRDLRDSSRAMYGLSLEVMLEKLGDVTLKSFDLEAVNRYSAQIAVPETVKRMFNGSSRKVRRGGPSAADTHVFLLSNIWQVCRDHAEFGIANIPNPTLDAKRRHKGTKNPAAPWNEEHQDKFIETAPDYLVLAYHMLKYFGQRGGDAIRVKWSDFCQQVVEDELVWGLLVAPEKGHDQEPVFCEIPKVLVNALKKAQKQRSAAPTILTNNWGKPWSTAMALSAAIRNHLIEIGLAKRGTKTLSMHGLRKNAAIMASDTDLGTAGIQALTLHKSKEMADYYAKRREQSRLRSKVIRRINEMEDEKAATKVKAKRASIRRVK